MCWVFFISRNNTYKSVSMIKLGKSSADRTQAIEAPERVVPQGEMSAGAARVALQATRGVLLDQLHAGDGLAYSGVLHPHPFLGVLDLYEWVYFLGAHERRHADQVRALAGQFAATDG
jgi:hypothetical protein